MAEPKLTRFVCSSKRDAECSKEKTLTQSVPFSLALMAALKTTMLNVEDVRSTSANHARAWAAVWLLPHELTAVARLIAFGFT